MVTPEQEAHATRQIEDFSDEFYVKYYKGQEEHGGNLWENPAMYLIEEAIKENLDMYAYLHALRDKIKALQDTKPCHPKCSAPHNDPSPLSSHGD